MARKTSKKPFRNRSRNKSRINRLRPLNGLLAAGLSLPLLAAAQSVPYPKYVTGPQPNGSWVVSDGQVITPAGLQVDLGIRVRAKAIALNPIARTHTAAVLTLGASEAVEVFDTNTGVVLQNYIALGADSRGSFNGIAYSADGKHLVFSQDSSNVTIAKVTDEGLLEDQAQVSVPPNNSFIKCFPNSPAGSYAIPCGTFYSPSTAYPGGVAVSKDGKSAYALLNQNDTLTKIDLTANPPKQGAQIRVGNVPHSIVIDRTGTTAYVSNEGGRAATRADFQIYSAGTEIVADQITGAAVTGTVSVVDLTTMKVTATISTGLWPIGKSLVEDDKLDLARKILADAKQNNRRLVLPVDHVIAPEFKATAPATTVDIAATPADQMGLDIGPKTAAAFAAEISRAKTIVWNGPMGVFEMPAFANGTLEVARAVATATSSGATSIVGGGDSVAAVHQCGVADRISHISTGGGASLEFLAGAKLPGVEALTDKTSEKVATTGGKVARRRVIAGNWKMFKTQMETEVFFSAFSMLVDGIKQCDIVIAPAFHSFTRRCRSRSRLSDRHRRSGRLLGKRGRFYRARSLRKCWSRLAAATSSSATRSVANSSAKPMKPWPRKRKPPSPPGSPPSFASGKCSIIAREGKPSTSAAPNS